MVFKTKLRKCRGRKKVVLKISQIIIDEINMQKKEEICAFLYRLSTTECIKTKLLAILSLSIKMKLWF